jgi:hypothetical protein
MKHPEALEMSLDRQLIPPAVIHVPDKQCAQGTLKDHRLAASPDDHQGVRAGNLRHRLLP